MSLRALACLALVAAGLMAADPAGVTLDQLRSFIQSAVKMKQSDKEVAAFVRQMHLANSLDDRTIEELQGMGAGPKTVAALRTLKETSANLPKAAPPPPKVIARPMDPPDSETQGKIISDAREYALSYTKNLPNFLCLQATERYASKTQLQNWFLYDRMVARLSYDGKKEDYKVIQVNNKSVDTTLERVGGAISSGDFGTFLKDIFDPESHAHFEWERWARLRGRLQYVFSYSIAQRDSKWHVLYGRSEDLVPAYQGLVYIDKELQTISRITMQTVGMPPEFPVHSASEVLDYEYQKIGDQEFLLPSFAEVNMTTREYSTRNKIEFRGYRRFGAEATFTVLDMDAPISDDKNKEQPAAKP